MKSVDAVVLFGILAAVFVIHGVDAEPEWDGLRVKTGIYDTNATNSSDSNFNIPRDVCELRKEGGYERVPFERGFRYPIDLYCRKNNSVMCFMYDKGGCIAGAQLSILEQDIANVSTEYYDYSAVTGFIKTNIYNRPAYSIRVFFTDPRNLTSAGRNDVSETAEELWVEINGTWVHLNVCQPNGPRVGDFYMQGCTEGLGQMFVYKFTENSTCNEAFWFYISYDRRSGSLVEFGIVFVGHGISPGDRDWYAHPTKEVLTKLFPARPPCFDELWKYGFTSLQVYLIDKPAAITCLTCYYGDD